MEQGIYKKQYNRLQQLINEHGYVCVNNEYIGGADWAQELMEEALDRATEHQILQFLMKCPSTLEDFMDEIEFYEFVMTEFAKNKAHITDELKVYFKFNN